MIYSKLAFIVLGISNPVCELRELLFLAYENGFQNHTGHLIAYLGKLLRHIKCIITLSVSLKKLPNFSCFMKNWSKKAVCLVCLINKCKF